ncbi:MAG: glycoside hydrolase family 18 protein [Bacteroidota bacterium]
MSNQKVYVPLTGPTSIQGLSAKQQSDIIAYVSAVAQVGTDNIVFQMVDGIVNLVITPKPPISAAYITDNCINYDNYSFEQNILEKGDGVVTKVGSAVIVSPAIMAQLTIKTNVANVTPDTLKKNIDITKTTFGDLKNIIAEWSNIPPANQIIGTSDLGPISESSTLTESTLLSDCKLYDATLNVWRYYFTASGAEVGLLSNVPLTPRQPAVPKGYKICLYYSSWGIYGRNYYPPAIDYSRITHLIYAFANIAPDTAHPEPNGKILEDGTVYMPDINDIRVNFKSLADIRTKYPHLKTILSIGGWTYSVNFSDTAADPVKLQRFVDSAYNLMTTYGFDGIDVDWEIPVEGGNGIKHRPADKENFTTMLQALRDKIGKDKLLTIASPARPAFNDNIEVEKVSNILDWINIMAYDYHGPWPGDTVTNFNAPLFPDPNDPSPIGTKHDLNIDATVRSLLTKNVPAEKLVLGLSFYGRAFSGVGPGPQKNGLYQPYSGHPDGTWPDEKGQASGVFDYWDLHDNYIGKAGWQQFYNHQAGAAWLFNEEKGIFIGYDDPHTIWNKCAYLASHQLGGAMVWEASNDRYNQLLYVVSHALNEGGIKASGGLVPKSGGDLPTWSDSSLSANGAIRLSELYVAKTTEGIVGIKTVYNNAVSEWRGSADGIISHIKIPADRFIDRVDFYLGSGSVTFVGLGLSVDNRTYIALGDTQNVDNLVSIGTESSRLTYLEGTVTNGQLVQLSCLFDQSQKASFVPFTPLQNVPAENLEGTPTYYALTNGHAYVGKFQGSVSKSGIEASVASAGADTPHFSLTLGSVDASANVSTDGGFAYDIGLQFQPIHADLKIGNPDNPAIEIEYEGPDFGFSSAQEVTYKKGQLTVNVGNDLAGVDLETGKNGFVLNSQFAGEFSETLEITSDHIKIGFDGNGIEINKHRVGVFFGIGGFSIDITLINIDALVKAVKDFINFGKSIWEASFKIFLAFKNFVTGVVGAMKDVIKLFFG